MHAELVAVEVVHAEHRGCGSLIEGSIARFGKAGYRCVVIPHVAPPVWPTGIRAGRFASTIVSNGPDLLDRAESRAIVAKCQVGLLGVPDDTGVEMNHGRVGAKHGPAAFRAALAKYGVASPADGSMGTTAYPRVFDCGDMIIGRDIHETHDHVSEAVLAILEMGLFPVAVGGGHDLTFAFVRGVARAYGTMTGAYIDAHLDVRTEVGSGMPFRALIEGGYVSNIACVGMNPLVNTREHAEYLRARGGEIVAGLDAQQAMACLGDKLGPGSGGEDRRAFVSLDMDALDASVAPGVSALNASGFLAREVQEMVALAGRSPAVRCFDIMELNPLFDQDGRTARVAAHMFLTFLRALAERPSGKTSGGVGVGGVP